jgi:hypothetical protein
MTLDQMAAQMVMRARQIERVVHDHGPWSVYVCGQGYFSARKVVGEDHVSFYALVRIDRPGMIELHCKGETVAVRLIDEPPGEIQLIWEFDMALASA